MLDLKKAAKHKKMMLEEYKKSDKLFKILEKHSKDLEKYFKPVKLPIPKKDKD